MSNHTFYLLGAYGMMIIAIITEIWVTIRHRRRSIEKARIQIEADKHR